MHLSIYLCILGVVRGSKAVHGHAERSQAQNSLEKNNYFIQCVYFYVLCYFIRVIPPFRKCLICHHHIYQQERMWLDLM